MTITTQELDRERWAEYFESIGPSLEGLLVTIEVFDEQIGDQFQAERLPLQTIGYDPKDDTVEIAVGGRGVRYPVLLRHFISAPRTIGVEQGAAATPSAILITDTSGERTLVRLFEPAELGA